ncbi:MAG: carbohydrate kinase family protein [Verrucomicrobiota bacterium]|nr:carbohydrate kinase family protein [Verrucomicrobiota bacterium]
MKKRGGISAGGNWLLDVIKVVDTYPKEGNLANILETKPPSNGGCPYNVLLDIAKLETGIPLQGIGALGDDKAADYILNDCKTNGINTKLLHKKQGEVTSYTDVFNVKETGYRTFFHGRGANAFLDINDFDTNKISGRICLLGYLLLLDTLDTEDAKFGTRAAALLSKLSEEGIETAIDIVSEDSERFSKIVMPALPYVDYLIINEVEASKTLNIAVRDDSGSLIEDNIAKVAELLIQHGVRKQVIIHYPEGSFSHRVKDNEQIFEKSLVLPKDFIVGATGAGDAFCAGTLYGIYSEWDTKKTLQFASGMAAASLSEAPASLGIRPIDEIWEIIENYS